MRLSRPLTGIAIGLLLIVAGAVVWCAPVLIGALEMMSVDNVAEKNHTVFFVPPADGRDGTAAFAGATLVCFGVVVLILGGVAKLRR